MSIIKLSPKQQEIVNFKDGPILVKASAGSGKTRVLTERIKCLLDDTKRKILAITFTNKAGEEMKDRLGSLTGYNDRLFIGTFHGFCQQVLENHGNLIGFSKMPNIFEEESDRLKLIEQALRATPSYLAIYKSQDKKGQSFFLHKSLEFISQVKRELLSEEQLYEATNDENDVMLFKAYQEILSNQNAIDFDDLLLFTYNLFVTHPSVTALYRRTYEYICIDEAQDLNNAQYQLLMVLTNREHRNVMLVGDPNQSIFAFNGSSPSYMSERFVEDFKPKIVELKENFRSSKKVLWAAGKIIPNSTETMNTVIEGIFNIQKTADEKEEASWILNKILKLISLKSHPDIEGEISYEKIAVLARNKYVFKELENALISNDIPFYYKITPGSIKFESGLMKIFDLALRVKLNSQDTLHFNRLSELLGVKSQHTLQNLINDVQDQLYKNILELVINLRLDGSNFKTTLNSFSEFIRSHAQVNDDNEKKMIINDIEEVLIHWYNYAVKVEKKSLSNFKNSMALGHTHPNSQQKGITLSTVHTMKGQEYEIIFLMGMDNETFPDYRAIKAGGLEMIQEKNNLYVAFTRAKRFLYVTWPEKRLMPWGDIKTRNISSLLKDF